MSSWPQRGPARDARSVGDPGTWEQSGGREGGRHLREGHERGAVGESAQRVLMGRLCPSNKAEDGTVDDGGSESDLGRSLVEQVKESNPFPSLDPYTTPRNPNSLYWSRT